MRKILLLLLISVTSYAQKTVKITEQTLKLKPNTTQEWLFGFASGDEVQFSFVEENGKLLSEVSVSEYPEIVKFRAVDVKKVKKERLKLQHSSVLQFQLKNQSDKELVVSVAINRIPKSKALQNFNTAVTWVTKQDTIWTSVAKDVVVGYDTLLVQKTRKVAYYDKKYEELVLDKNQRVNAKTTFSSSTSEMAFSLPKNQINEDETKKVIAWAYWVGVGKESNEYWNQNRKMIVGAVQGVASYFTTPLGGIAAGAITNLTLPSNGEDVAYTFLDETNKKLFLAEKPFKSYDSGKGIAAYKRFTETGLLQGNYVILLNNDNYVQPIDVNVKISAIMEHKKFKTEMYTDKQITPRYEKRIISEPSIESKKIPVTSNYK
ncbi:hypothetical protein [Flavobacterium sp.]|uniref:hypothetical protein n=1 Tax=Flavobacterium sp. TaxID=239 RepID=UPI0028BD8DFD|nr:hypothetical protein [Flavobacterium sp.]